MRLREPMVYGRDGLSKYRCVGSGQRENARSDAVHGFRWENGNGSGLKVS